FGSSYEHAWATLLRLVIAFAISFILGTVLGIMAGRRKVVFELLSNPAWTFMAVPSVVWAFIFAIAAGVGNVVPVLALMALLVPTVLVNVAEGAKALPYDILEMATSYRIMQGDRVRHIYLPFLAPYLASSARIAFS